MYVIIWSPVYLPHCDYDMAHSCLRSLGIKVKLVAILIGRQVNDPLPYLHGLHHQLLGDHVLVQPLPLALRLLIRGQGKEEWIYCTAQYSTVQYNIYCYIVLYPNITVLYCTTHWEGYHSTH